MPSVLIADDLSPRATEILKSAGIEVSVQVGLKKDQLLAAIPAFDGLAVRSATQVTAEVIEAAAKLKIVGRAGIGVDNIDVKAASRRGVIVMNTPSGNAVTTAEHAIALLMSLARKIPAATASVKGGKWEKKKFQGMELQGKTLGVVGLGNIGRIVASRAVALQMNVIGHDPFISEDGARKLGVQLVSLGDLFAKADVITIHTPMTAETRGLIGVDALRKMKKGVLIVNAARGGIVDEQALHDALVSGQVGAAALDVFEKEPVPPDHPLLKLDNVVCTPHLGASTEEAQEKVAIEVAEQMVAYFAKGEIKNAVNVPALSKEVRERLGPYLDLAGRLGAFQAQLLDHDFGIREIQIEITGEAAASGTRPLVATALAGLLRGHLDVPVNEVNAPLLAEERGIKVTEIRRDRGANFTSSISVRACGKSGDRHVRGAVFNVADRSEPRLVEIDDVLVEASPEGRILLIRNEDRPGVIGAVGTYLGGRGINVSRMQVGLDRERREALQLWNVDGELTPAMLDEIRKLPHVRSAQTIEL